MKLTRAASVLGMAAAVSVAALSPAAADSTYVTDPKGDLPDIRRLTLKNNQSAVVLKQKYTDISEVGVDTVYIKWGSTTHYRVNLGNYDEDAALEKRLTLSTKDGDKSKACGAMTAKRDEDTNVTTFKVPRSCLPKAPNKILAKGVATMGNFNIDQTKATDKVARG